MSCNFLFIATLTYNIPNNCYLISHGNPYKTYTVRVGKHHCRQIVLQTIFSRMFTYIHICSCKNQTIFVSSLWKSLSDSICMLMSMYELCFVVIAENYGKREVSSDFRLRTSLEVQTSDFGIVISGFSPQINS